MIQVNAPAVLDHLLTGLAGAGGEDQLTAIRVQQVNMCMIEVETTPG